MYLAISSGNIAAISNIRRTHPNISLPRNPSDETLTALGYARIHSTPRPTGDVVTQSQPEERDGKWYQTWEVRDYTEDELEDQLEQLRANKISEINSAYSAAVDPLIREYPEPEPLSWAHQDTEAQAYLAWQASGAQGDAPATPVLEQILAGRNGDDGTETMLELCEAVERNAVAFRQSQVLTGKRQRLVRLVREAESIEEVEAVEWG